MDTSIDYTKEDEFGKVCRDFDEMRTYLKESVERQLEDEQWKKDLVISISCDHRTPLTSISGYLDGLMDGIASTPEKGQRYLSAIKTRAKDLSRPVDSLSEYNRLDSSSLHYHLEPVGLERFIEQYLISHEEGTGQNRVEFRFTSEGGELPVLLDREEMKRVLDNLFTNTIHCRRHPHSNVVVSLRRAERSTVTEFIFSDDGPGVSEESLDRLFESFYRMDGARSNSGEDSGVGLAVVKEIMSGHKGIVHVENHGDLVITIYLSMTEER